jgi:hypothetical protein
MNAPARESSKFRGYRLNLALGTAFFRRHPRRSSGPGPYPGALDTAATATAKQLGSCDLNHSRSGREPAMIAISAFSVAIVAATIGGN